MTVGYESPLLAFRGYRAADPAVVVLWAFNLAAAVKRKKKKGEKKEDEGEEDKEDDDCLLYTSPSPRDATLARMPSSA